VATKKGDIMNILSLKHIGMVLAASVLFASGDANAQPTPTFLQASIQSLGSTTNVVLVAGQYYTPGGLVEIQIFVNSDEHKAWTYNVNATNQGFFPPGTLYSEITIPCEFSDNGTLTTQFWFQTYDVDSGQYGSPGRFVQTTCVHT
jgi:hypothetical protein